MLSIEPVKNSAHAGHYYERDNYYMADSPEAKNNSAWWGKGAEILNLSGEVNKDVFIDLLNGKLPTGEQLGIHHNGKLLHRHGYDLTFSAPKSVSLLLELGGDTRLLEAHNKAVNSTLLRIEDELSCARKTFKGKTEYEKTHNLIVAKFRHDTSRALDPMLHTHAVVMNATQRNDGRFKALGSQSKSQVQNEGARGFMEQLYKEKLFYGSVYRGELAFHLQNLGYQINKTHKDGRFEIAGVPKDVITSFSKRRNDIEKALEEKGLSGAKNSAWVTLITRANKQQVTRDELKSNWYAEANKLGFDAKSLVAEARETIPKSLSNEDKARILTDAVAYAKEHLAERQAAFARTELEKIAFTHSLGEITPQDIKNQIDAEISKNLILKATTTKGEALITTPEAIALEESNLAFMRQGKEISAPVTSTLNASFCLGIHTLNLGQFNAAMTALTMEDQIIGIQGFAGVGKTTLLKAVNHIACAQGYMVKGIAPSAVAAKELEKGAQISSQTLTSFLMQKEPITQEKQLWVLDESSMASSRQFNDLLKLCHEQSAKLIVVGDKMQLSAIEAGKPFEQLQKAGMKTAIVSDIVRQRDDILKEAVYKIIAGDVQGALARVTNIQEISDKNTRLSAVANAYLALPDDKRSSTLVITPANDDRVIINNLIRQGLQHENKIAYTNLSVNTLEQQNFTLVEKKRVVNYETGMFVRFNKSYQENGLKVGQYYTVVDRNLAENLLKLSNNQEIIDWQPAKIAGGTHGMVEIYKTGERAISEGDKIRWTRNDKSRGIINSETATVESIKNHKIRVTLSNNEKILLDMHNKQDLHFDHAYASTAYAVQGKTGDRVIAHDESFREQLTSLKSFYIILSRARDSVTLIVDNKEAYAAQLQENKGEKLSAIETHAMAKENIIKPMDSGKRFSQYNKAISPEKIFSKTEESVSSTSVDDVKKARIKAMYSYDKTDVLIRLNQQVTHIAEKLLGAPNHKLSNNREWRYGNNGSFVISVAGDKMGLWKDFERDEGGNLINLIQREMYTSFKEALKIAIAFTGSEATPLLKNSPINHTQSPNQRENRPTENDLKRMQIAKSIAEKSRHISQTLAQKYLENRGIGIQNVSPDIQFIDKFYQKEQGQYFPAMMNKARNLAGEVECIELVFLDHKSGRKADIFTPKKQFGCMKFGACVNVQDGDNRHIFIAEGVETALSIANANPDKKVIASLSIGNIKSVLLPKDTKCITICADNDNGKQETFIKLLATFTSFLDKGIDTYMTIPEKIKTDFNDLLRENGLNAVKETCQKQVKITREVLKEITELKHKYENNNLGKTAQNAQENVLTRLITDNKNTENSHNIYQKNVHEFAPDSGNKTGKNFLDLLKENQASSRILSNEVDHKNINFIQKMMVNTTHEKQEIKQEAFKEMNDI